MTKYLLIILTTLLLLSETSEGQIVDIKTKYKFYKFESNRTYNLKTGSYIEVISIDSNDNNLNEFKKHSFGGYLTQLNDSFLTIDMNSQDIIITNRDSSFKQLTNFLLERQISLPIDKIKHIEYEPNAAMVFAVIGGLSLVSTIFVAPLASVNYGYRTFNSDRYLAIVKPSLIGSLLGLTLHYSFQTRRLQIKPNR